MKSPESKEKKRLTIQIASPADAEGIGHVQSETWLETYPNEELGITREDIQTKVAARRPTSTDRWRGTTEDETGKMRIWVAKDRDQVVGFCFAMKGEDENKIQAMYVLPTFHGMGIGQKLISEAFQWFGQDKPVSVSVVKYNVNAIAFYKKAGFEEAGDIPPSPAGTLPSGKILPEIKMLKRF